MINRFRNKWYKAVSFYSSFREFVDNMDPILLLLILSIVANYESEGIRVVNRQDLSSIENFKQVSRNERSSKSIMCPESSVTRDVVIKERNLKVKCDCEAKNDEIIVWLDYKCNILKNNKHVTILNQSLTIAAMMSNTSVYFCTNNKNCTSMIRLTDEVIVEKMSVALQGFLMFLVILSFSGLLCIIFKKYRYQIYLNCRDSCAPSSDKDGNEIDAYISLGKSIDDIKFVEKNIVSYLQGKYNYKLFTDEDNLLPRLDYSENVQAKMHQSHRLIIVFTPAYMTNEWCMYCFSEGLRKLLELNVKMIFIITDSSIQRELNTLSSLVGHVPKIFISSLPMMQSKKDKELSLRKLRVQMPAKAQGGANDKGMRAPMLRDAEDIDQRSLRESDTYGGTTYTSGNEKTEMTMDDFGLIQQDLEYDDVDPDSIRVNQYKTRKDFFRIALVDDADEKQENI